MVDKVATDIKGFDEITKGGLPAGRTTLVMGGPGSGKTVFALQTLVNGARLRQEPGIFVAFEENTQQLKANGDTFGWNLDELSKDLFFLNAQLDPQVVQSGDFELTGMLAMLQAKARQMGARRVVFDGIDVLLALLGDPAAERREIYRLHHWLQQSGLTGVITAKVESPDQPASHYGFLQFMADCVITFHHHLADNVSLRGLRVTKYRGSSHSANEFPLVITGSGIQVAGHDTRELSHEASTEQVSSGIARLDTMLGGGYFRGSCALISGAPGTAKTTLAAAFIEVACHRGERALLVSFDEAAAAIARNLASVGIRLAPHIKSGLLRIYSIRSEAYSAEEHAINIQRLIAEHEPSALVVDPVSALSHTGGRLAATNVTTRLIDLAKERAVTTIVTSLVDSPNGLVETSASDVSTIADTWIHLAYVIRGGERNRAITIVKSRGARHSNQVRELLLSDEGVTLADVYTAGDEVLMGSARWQKEAQEEAEEARLRQRLEHKRREVKGLQADLKARMEALRRELEASQAELKLLEEEEQSRRHARARQQGELLQIRSADRDASQASGGGGR